LCTHCGTTEVVPFQNFEIRGVFPQPVKAAPFQNNASPLFPNAIALRTPAREQTSAWPLREKAAECDRRDL
jgi:hypothetical protein